MNKTRKHEPHTLLVPVAAGELLDKITILRLKTVHLRRPEALNNVQRELHALEKVLEEAGPALQTKTTTRLMQELQLLNTKLWNVEDDLRLLEAKQQFDEDFIAKARSVYQLNDQRAAIKRHINESCGSSFVEEKSYGAK